MADERFNLLRFNGVTGTDQAPYIDDAFEIASKVIFVKPVIAPTALSENEVVNGAYVPCPPKYGSIDFVISYSASDEGTISVKVYQADRPDAEGAAEIGKYAISKVVSAKESGKIYVFPVAVDVEKDFITVYVSADADVMIDAFALIRAQRLI